jgi:hypothetical protein
MDKCDSRPLIQKLEFRYGQVQYVCFHETRTSKVWDSYVIFMELKIIFRHKQRLKDMGYPKQCLFCKLLVKGVYYAFD